MLDQGCTAPRLLMTTVGRRAACLTSVQ